MKTITYPIFFVVNDNVLTRNPSNTQLFPGPYCDRTGYQVDDPKYATPYYTHRGAQGLVNRLNREGISCPEWARKMTNSDKEVGQYRIIEGVVTL